jgi:hypothetical protein
MCSPCRQYQQAIWWWPVFWSQWALSWGQHGSGMTTAMLSAVRQRPLPERKLRTPLLTLHVNTLPLTLAQAQSARQSGERLRSV